MANNELYHHGILGMKWGVRRTPEELGHKKTTPKKRQSNWSDDAKNTAALRKKNVNELSNAELQALNNRMNLEKNYRQLNPSTIKKGLLAVTAITSVMTSFANLYNANDKLVSIGEKVASDMMQNWKDVFFLNSVKDVL